MEGSPRGDFAFIHRGDFLAANRQVPRGRVVNSSNQINKVVLPEPDGPIMATKLLRGISKVTLSSARTSNSSRLYVRVTFVSCTSVHLAVSPQVANLTGHYFTNSKHTNTNNKTNTAMNREQLGNKSLQMVAKYISSRNQMWRQIDALRTRLGL